jgi:glycosyltransferase involved in cell wall biosynthesis
MTKFILIDHSIIDVGGHHYEYAMRVLQAAQEAGYTPILATNRKFGNKESIPWDVYPVYKYGFWFRLTPPTGYRIHKILCGRFTRWVLCRKYKLMFSPLGFFWSICYPPGKYRGHALSLAGTLNVWQLISLFFLTFPIIYLFTLGRAVKNLLIAALPFQRYLNTLLNQFKGVIQAIFPIAELARNRHLILLQLFNIRRAQMFGKDTRRLFRHLHLEEGDIVFIPTLSEVEMQGLLQYFRKDPNSTKASWHLLFRRNIHVGREPEYQEQGNSLRPLKMAFHKFHEDLTEQKVYFYTDTERLTAQYNCLHVTRFRTLPIPISRELQDMSHRRSERTPLRIIYVGDARKEKGYHYLPQIVQDLWADYVETGKVVFTFQSNFNIPEGELEAVIARSQLEGFPKDKVRLITEPLSTEGYRDLLLSGDINLLLYERDNYYARSSGILAESLSAGIPVIVPAGTWMAEQFIEETYRYHATLKDTMRIVRAFEGTGLQWGNTGNSSSNPMSQGQLIFGGEPNRSFCWLYPPRSSAFLLVSFKLTVNQSGVFVLPYIDQLSFNGYSLLKKPFVIGKTLSGCDPSVLLPIKKGAQRIWLGFRNAFANFPVTISDIQIDFLAPEPLQQYPLGAVGLTYTYPDEISDCIREMVDNYLHYKETARAFSQRWFEKHNAGRLVRELKDVTRPIHEDSYQPTMVKADDSTTIRSFRR